jgi:hypothetical protein
MSLQSINRARLFSELVTLHINTERPDWGFVLSCETLFAAVIMSSDGEDSDVESTAPAYDQQEIITQLTDFYQFLSTLPYIEPSAVLTPPSLGWPNVTKENFSELGKNDEVINLLKHLPYIDLSGHQYVIAPDTYPTDYRGEAFQHEVTKESIGRCTPLGDVEFPEWVINLTHGSRDGTYVMLDTTDGKIQSRSILAFYGVA